MSKRFLLTLATIIVIGLAAGVAVFLAKGYRFSAQEKRVVGTGILTVNSEPDAASVFIDGHLTTATNATVSSLTPKQYDVRVVKEGFIPWERKVEVKEGLVTELKISLFPSIPSVYPLTYTGVENPVLSPDGSKLAYIVPPTKDEQSAVQAKKAGVWVWTMAKNQPIAFARGAEPHQITDNSGVDYSKATLRWSPDSKQLIATVGNNNYLLEADNFNNSPRDITPTLNSTLNVWQDDIKAKDSARIANLADLDAKKTASASAIVKWAPDETKFIYREKALSDKEKDPKVQVGGFKIFNLEDNKSYDLPPVNTNFWLPDSRHVLLVDNNTISIVDFDGTNRAVIYAGSFIDNLVFAWPDSSRLVIVNTFPTPTASQPNLYGINLK